MGKLMNFDEDRREGKIEHFVPAPKSPYFLSFGQSLDSFGVAPLSL